MESRRISNSSPTIIPDNRGVAVTWTRHPRPSRLTALDCWAQRQRHQRPPPARVHRRNSLARWQVSTAQSRRNYRQCSRARLPSKLSRKFRRRRSMGRGGGKYRGRSEGTILCPAVNQFSISKMLYPRWYIFFPPVIVCGFSSTNAISLTHFNCINSL